ncbi:cyclic nucleotide-binding domain-containing protein [Actinocorallia longicatena]|uniref:Cyclic nucleotide-binding domain-containing protein n=1 Tax=Actinocorallia longicatena TaxID=111803 RepID=A0ABP6QA53_9ACTN
MSVAEFSLFKDDSGRFWPSLDEYQRARLLRDGWIERFPDGVDLCRQGERGDRVFILRSGQVEIRHQEGKFEQVLAIRGEGDLVGERAAFEARERSASVVAQGWVEALVVLTDKFGRFIMDNPDVRALVEDNVYGRLTETRPPEPFTYAGQNCTVLMIDITAFNGKHRSDGNRQVVRDVMYEVLKRACKQSKVPWSDCHREDRGDGALVIVPPTVPTVHVLHPMVQDLAEAVRDHNARAARGEELQIRLALHVGPVTGDTHGMVGEAINTTARLLDARPLKRRIADGGAAVGVIVSDYVHGGIVKHLRGVGTWEQIRFQVKESRLTGWVRLL